MSFHCHLRQWFIVELVYRLVFRDRQPSQLLEGGGAELVRARRPRKQSKYACNIVILTNASGKILMRPINTIQIVTGIEVNSESYFQKLREYCPSAEGTRAIFPQLREIRLTIDR